MSKHRRRIAVFGGTGFLGTHLVRALSSNDFEIVIPSRRPARHKELLVLPNLQVVQADIRNKDEVDQIVENADIVVNLIGILNESKKRNTFERIHAVFPAELAESCRKHKVSQLLHVSSIGAAVDAPSAYLRSKGRAEAALKEFMDKGLSITIFRPSVIFGANDSFTRKFELLLRLAKGVFLMVCPDARMQPVYVKDVVQCMVRAIGEPAAVGQIYELGGPEELTLFEIVSRIDKLTGGNHKIIRLSQAQSSMLASFIQFVPGKFFTPDNLLSLQVPNVCSNQLPDWFGYQPRRFTDVAATYLQVRSNRFDRYRRHARR